MTYRLLQSCSPSSHDLKAAAAAGIHGVRFSGGSLLECVARAFAQSAMPALVP
jgi:hypothetical protein